MKKAFFIAVIGAVLSLPFVSGASTVAATPADQPIVPGEWHLSLSKALAMAQATGIPVLGFWANTGCQNCADVIDQAVNTPEFAAWRRDRKPLLVFGEGKTLAGDLYDWVDASNIESDGSNAYPFIRIYWVEKDGTVRVNTRFSGYPYRANAQTLINKIESYIATFTYSGRVKFACTPGLEMEPDTPSVPLPLIRENGSDGILTNTLSFTRTLAGGGSTNWLETLVWSEGETGKTVTVANEGHYVGGSVTLTLSAAGEDDQTAVIAMVEERAVSTTNPRFLGEPFAFGEWTMDLAAATNAVAATNATAYTLVLFTGSLWCPYCIGMERDWLSTPAFKDFVRTNNIALVAIDNYKRDGSAPTLLRYDVYRGATNDTRNGHSGAGYLSRHGIPVATAEAVLARNMAVQAAWTLPGATRIGYPTLLLLRKDGSIAGRTSGYYVMTDATVVPAVQSFDLGINMARLNELLALARDPLEGNEERNGHYSTTADALGAKDIKVASLRSVDVTDVYRLGTAAGLRQTVSVSGPLNASVQVAMLDSAGTPLQSLNGSLTSGVAVTANITGTGRVYAAVTASGAAVQLSSPNPTVRPYAIETRYELFATEAAQTLDVAPFAAGGTFDTSLTVVSNAVYRFAAGGAALSFPAGGFEAAGGDLFRALSDGVAALRLTDVSAGDTLSWQLWQPGRVGFAQAAASVSETATNVVIAVRRTDGSSGACSVSVALNAAGTTATAGDDFVDVFGAGAVLTWADGETGTKTISLPLRDDAGYEGEEVVALTLAVAAGAATLAADGADYRLTIVENDQPVVGRLAFAGASAPYAKTSPLTIVAREGSQVTLGVERVEGASTAVSAQLTATAGIVEPAALVWAHNDRVTVKTSVVTLPMLAQVPQGVVTLTLVPGSTIQAVPGKDSVVVQLIAADAPVFARETAAFSGQTRVAFDQTIRILQAEGGKLSVERLSGSLPDGIKAAFDAAAGVLRLTGLPKKAGAYTAVYQVSEIRGSRRVMGGVVLVTINVVALETVNAAAARSVSLAEGAVIDRGLGRVVGTLRLSLTRATRLTAKYQGLTQTVSFSRKNWSACDAEGTVTAVVSKGDYGLTIRMTAAGELSAVVIDPDAEGPLMGDLAMSPWNASTPATDYVGYYTASLSPAAAAGEVAPSGHSYMTISLGSSAERTGKAKYAGKMADGTSYSGSAVLRPLDGAAAEMVVFTRKSRHVLAGLFAIAANAKATYKTYPSAISACGDVEPYCAFDSGYDETSFDVVLDVCGGYYNSADSLQEYYDLYEEAGPMVLMASGAVPGSSYYGAATALPAADLTVTDVALRIPRENDNPTKIRLSFSKTTGLFHGTFKIPFSLGKTLSATYSGVLLPGWVGDCGCGAAEVELPEKPFGMGAYWFRDRIPVGSGSSLKSVSRGYPIIIQKVGSVD